MQCEKENSIEITFGWLSIFSYLLIHSIRNKNVWFFTCLLFDVIMFCLCNKVFLLLTLLFYYVMTANHEYGHYILAKKLKLGSKPIKLAVLKHRSYIVYSLDRCENQNNAIAIVRLNALIFDIISIILASVIPCTLEQRLPLLGMSILNLCNYFILTEGSDGIIIYKYIKCEGIKNLLRLYFATIRRIKWISY